ncbi:DUF1361 domain-containing protein [Candidatus Enterococcus ferrettii]|uniref:DUF1361 domain-containing protein n=1 Tax=Candidatus Enterococcus ferrettii TaxID=2815324 RepID=A0ABV0EVF4_9ENTE|nr:DUF1361 domain-containing protein [Enterococcus sp. 665A]MBO1341649.1 DUF1361 domain-containing protein [Enterococcus sp. 665A]
MNNLKNIRILFIIYIIALIPFYVYDLPIHFLLIDSLLAYLPLEIYSYMKGRFQKKRTTLFFIFYILFIPNNAYLLTDLVHLNRINFYTSSNLVMSENVLIWMMFVLAVGGILSLYILGVQSEQAILRLLSEKYSLTRNKNLTILFILFFLISIGVFLGRFLRFNSVNVLNHPVSILQAIPTIFRLDSMAFILLFTILQTILFFVLSSKE